MNACGHCHAPLTEPSTTSQVLEGAFHDACYYAAWKLKDVRAQQAGGWQVDAWSSGVGVHAGVENAGMVAPKEEERVVEVTAE